MWRLSHIFNLSYIKNAPVKCFNWKLNVVYLIYFILKKEKKEVFKILKISYIQTQVLSINTCFQSFKLYQIA